MTMSKTIKHAGLTLALLTAVASVPTSAMSVPVESCSSSCMVSKVAKILTVGFLAGCLIRLNTKEADSNPVRYNWDELCAGENILNNLQYLLDDGLIGQCGTKAYATIDPDNGRVSVSTPKWPKGLMGWFAFYYKGVLSGAGMTWFIYTLAQTVCDPEVNATNLVEVFAKKVKAQAKVLGLPKWADVGLPIVVGAAAHASLTSN